jgi:uncharacterized protein YbjT (DUF2867 family)
LTVSAPPPRWRLAAADSVWKFGRVDFKLVRMAVDGGRIALVAGGSGLVGGRLLPLLLNNGTYSRVYALSRRALPMDHPRLANRVVRFGPPLETQLKGLKCQDAYCCLGTTMREAGSPEALRAVDHDLVLEFARFALKAGAERIVVVSSVGANRTARNFYLRVKGEMERSLETIGFRALDFMQPSLLLGARRQARPLEFVAQAFMWAARPLFLGATMRYRAIEADTVAAAMYGAARIGRRGIYRHQYDDMRALAAAATRERPRAL